MKYLINNSIIFIPNDGLYVLESDSVDIKLSMIADRILFLLIHSKGMFISKQKIHDSLWQEYGVDSSTASINNNLSFLRKVFKDLGIDDLIVTTPKVGISLAQNIPIVVVEDKTTSPMEIVNNNPVVRKRKSQLLINCSILLLISLALIWLIALFYNKKKVNEYVTTINNCRVLSPRVLSDSEREQLIYFVTSRIKLKSINCKENNVIFANIQTKGSGLKQKGREFFSLCEVNGNFVYSCESDYYMDGAK